MPKGIHLVNYIHEEPDLYDHYQWPMSTATPSYQLVLSFQFHYHFTFILYLGLERMRRGEERERESVHVCAGA